MRVAKDFRWEAAHRIPWHQAGCRNLHGHSYQMTVVLEGAVGTRGMVIDFQEIKRLVEPLVRAWDHATLVHDEDTDLREALEPLGGKVAVLPCDTTAENLVGLVLQHIQQAGGSRLAELGVTRATVRIRETSTSFAEDDTLLAD